jgi:HEAT repeat protein
MTSTCPACNKAVDPLRSRFVRVVGGKVVAYCSAACAPAQSAAPRAEAARPEAARPGAARAEAARVDPARAISPSSGVPALISTPPSGVPSRATAPSSTPSRATPASGVPSRATPASGVPARSTPPAGVPVRSTPSSGAAPPTPPAGAPAGPRAAPDVVSPGPPGPPLPRTPAHGVRASLDSGPVIEIVHEPASGVLADAGGAIDPGSSSGSAGSAPGKGNDDRGDPETEPRAASPARDDGTQPRVRHPDEIAIGEFWTADKERSGAARAAVDPGSGTSAGSGTGPAARATGRDDTLDRWTTDTGGGRTERAVSEAVEARPAGRFRLVLLILVLLAAGGALVYQYLLKDSLAAALRTSPSPAAAALVVDVPAPEPPQPPPLDVEGAVARARAILQAHLTASSQRVQRIAAAALARTGDQAARDVLAAHIGVGLAGAREPGRVEPSDIARLDLAYSLARGGDERGSDALAAALRSPRAEARDEAARLLALLGDRRAAPRLIALLAISQRRLGAAEHLAHLAEPRAIKVLEQLRGDSRASADDKARATIALGVAGQTAVAPALRDMLGDPHFNAFAAAALVELDDRAARPVLEHQLDSPSLRVRAARALRRLEPALDPAPLLPRLLAMLRTGRDRDQIHAAEAILVLAGPAAWSAHP